MAITIVYENEYSKAYFDTELKAGIIDWKSKKLTDEEYKRPLEALIEYTKETTIFENYMSDIRLQSVVSPNSRKWFETVMIPAAIKNGLKRGAVIITKNPFKKHYMNMIISSSKKFPIKIKVFDNPEKAK
ncbi:MAG: hypothetical protein DRI86_04175, partial [Bacteroidetes bacterium]